MVKCIVGAALIIMSIILWCCVRAGSDADDTLGYD